MFKIIQPIAIKEEIRTDGHSPLLILANDFKDYIVKNDKGFNPPYGILNEIIANQFLKKWKIPTPKMSLMYMDKELLGKNNLSEKHQWKFYNNYPCFASEFIQNAIELNTFLITFDKYFFNKITNPLDVFRLTLFDTWLENDDRKPTNYNVLLKPINDNFEIVAIDNAYLLSTLAYNDLKIGKATFSSNDHLLVSELGHLIKKYVKINTAIIEREKDYFYFCVNQCYQMYDNLFFSLKEYFDINHETINHLKSFIFQKERNKLVFEEYIYRLNQ